MRPSSAQTPRRRALFPPDPSEGLGCVEHDASSPHLQPARAYAPLAPASPLGDVTNTHTPPKFGDSPTQRLKTPHDLAPSALLPRLGRQRAGDAPKSSSKVRTALFPDESPLSPLTFYRPTVARLSPAGGRTLIDKIKRRAARPGKEGAYLCGKRKGRNFLGQINAGVRHGIKKLKKVGKKRRKAELTPSARALVEEFISENVEKSPEVPDPSKKFFKLSRPKAVVTMSKNIKLEVSNGKMSLVQSAKPSLKRAKQHEPEVRAKKAKFYQDDFIDKSDDLIESSEITNIINKLDEKNSLDDVLMSPTSQMCNMASGLAINSPKKVKNLIGVLNEMPNRSEEKLYSIFTCGKMQMPAAVAPISKMKRFKGVAKDQMLLDAGQKKFGAKQCPECELIYHEGDPNDEIMHLQFHNAEHIFRYNGWKNERVITNDFFDGKIIKIIPSDSKTWWKKIGDLLEVVNRDLGFYEMERHKASSQVFLYVKNKKIVGVLVAEIKHKGHKLISAIDEQVDVCSMEEFPIKCGIARLWVSPTARKMGVATHLMNAMKKNFMFGYFLRNEDIAFSSPSDAGKRFGAKYFQSANFLIYIN